MKSFAAKHIIILSLLCIIGLMTSNQCFAAYVAANSIPITVSYQENPAQITLSWSGPFTTGAVVKVYKRLLTSEGDTWGITPIAQVTYPARSYIDTDVTPGTIYEYKVTNTTTQTGTVITVTTLNGWVCAGIKAPLVENRGKILLIVDKTFSAKLAGELDRLAMDMTGDGWTVIRHDFERDGIGKPADLKALIKSEYDQDPENVKSVLLFGHLPITFSGWSTPDGHYISPRATDAYYGDMLGVWTDSTVDCNAAGGKANKKGDGYWDQDYIPSASMTLEVGRVDMANMPSFPALEAELLKQYLDKDHNYRTGAFHVPDRVITVPGYSAGVESSIIALAGMNNIDQGGTGSDWFPRLAQNPYLWAVGMHAATVSELASNQTNAVFTVMFGSHHLNFEASDNRMRAVLATSPYALTCFWGDRPNWVFHHMAMGTTIGYSNKRTSHIGTEYYDTCAYGNYNGAIWTNLMGDPTLRTDVIDPVKGFTASSVSESSVALQWTQSSDSEILGYNIYRASNVNEQFTKLNTDLISGTEYTDTTSLSGDAIYMIRAVKLEQNLTGSYYNASNGAFLKVKDDHMLNNSPTAASLNITTHVNEPVYISVSGQDLDGDSIGYQIDTLPAHGTLSGSFPCIKYSPNTDYVGDDTFTYHAFDGTSSSSTAVVNIRIEPEPVLSISSYKSTADFSAKKCKIDVGFSKKVNQKVGILVKDKTGNVTYIGQQYLEDVPNLSFNMGFKNDALEGKYTYQIFSENLPSITGAFYYGSSPGLSYNNNYSEGMLYGNVINHSEKDVTGKILVALYKGAMLKKVTLSPTTCDAFSEGTPFNVLLKAEGGKLESDETLKIFFWDDLNSMKPFMQTGTSVNGLN